MNSVLQDQNKLCLPLFRQFTDQNLALFARLRADMEAVKNKIDGSDQDLIDLRMQDPNGQKRALFEDNAFEFQEEDAPNDINEHDAFNVPEANYTNQPGYQDYSIF